MWDSADVDGSLKSCAAGEGVMRSSTDWEWVPSSGADIVISRRWFRVLPRGISVDREGDATSNMIRNYTPERPQMPIL